MRAVFVEIGALLSVGQTYLEPGLVPGPAEA
jgi:hypothetical protein